MDGSDSLYAVGCGRQQMLTARVFFLIAVLTYPAQATSGKKWLILIYSFLRVMVYNGGGGMGTGRGGMRAGAGWTHYICNPQTE